MERREVERSDVHRRRKNNRHRKKRGGRWVFFIVPVFLIAFFLNSQLFGREGNQLPAQGPFSQDNNISAPKESSPNAINVGQNETVWSLILVNRWTPIPDNYEVEVTQLTNGESVDTRIYPALQQMFDAARADGVYPIVASGYRTAEEQQTIMDNKIASYVAQGYSSLDAKNEAETWVAVPGTSEHQLGISADINADGVHSSGAEVYDWLDKNGYRFGFIRRYPPDKTDITGVSNEPWHYRYVGVEAATEIYRQGICLEEYRNVG